MPENTQKKFTTIYKLVWKDDRSLGSHIQEYVLNQKITTYIGRDTGNHIILLDPKVSKQHAEIHWNEGKFVLVDQGSSNGTIVNGKEVTNPTPLENKDQIEFGDFVLSFFISEENSREKPKNMPLETEEKTSIKNQKISEMLTQHLPEIIEKSPANQPASEQAAELAELETSLLTPSKIIETEVTTLDEAPAEAETFLKLPVQEISSSHSENAFSDLLKNISNAQTSGNILKEKGLQLKKALEASIDQLQLVTGKMRKLEAEAAKVELVELFKKLASSPNDVTLLMELSEHTDLIEKFLKDYSVEAASIENIKAKLENDLKNYMG